MADEMRNDGHEPATRGELRGVRDELHDELHATRGELREVRDELRARLDGHDRRFTGIDENLRRLNIGFVKMGGDITELKSTVKGLVADFSGFSTAIERMSGNIESALRKMASQGSMLMEHEGRITKLESRPN